MLTPMVERREEIGILRAIVFQKNRSAPNHVDRTACGLDGRTCDDEPKSRKLPISSSGSRLEFSSITTSGQHHRVPVGSHTVCQPVAQTVVCAYRILGWFILQAMENPIDRYVLTALQSYTVIAVIAVLVGAAVFPQVAAFTEPDDQYIAVVNIDESISATSSQATIQELRNLRTNESVKAVVLKISSPGGGAAASEAQYMAVKRLAQEKPVYASVDSMAASGAYYTLLPSKTVFVKPGSLVGHVGVIATAPSEGLAPVVASGPDKAHGGMTQDEFRATVETMKRGFVGAVMNERGDRITIPRSEVAKAKAFVGARAVQNGYADQIGTLESAIKAAADDAGLSNYEVTYRNPFEYRDRGILVSGANTPDNATVTIPEASPFDYRGVETVQFLMIYGAPEDQEVIVNAAS